MGKVLLTAVTSTCGKVTEVFDRHLVAICTRRPRPDILFTYHQRTDSTLGDGSRAGLTFTEDHLDVTLQKSSSLSAVCAYTVGGFNSLK